MMRVPSILARSPMFRTVVGLALTGVFLGACVPQGAGSGVVPRDSQGGGTVLNLFGNANVSSPNKPDSATRTQDTATQQDSSVAASATTRILLQQDDLRLRPAGGRKDAYQLMLPRLGVLGAQAQDGERLLIQQVQAILAAAGSTGQVNAQKKTLTVKATPEQVKTLTHKLESLRDTLAFAHYTLEVWTGALPEASQKGGQLPVDAAKGTDVEARTVAATAVSEPRLVAAGGRRLQQDAHLVMIGATAPAQFAYSAPVDYIASSSSLDGSMNMTVERFPTRLNTQIETRQMVRGAETTLTLVGKGLERFRKEQTAGMSLKVPLPKTVSLRVPFLSVADKAVVVSGLKGFGRPCLQSGQYCPYELAGGDKPQDETLTLVARSAVYAAEAVPMPVVAKPQPSLPVTVAEGKASLPKPVTQGADAPAGQPVAMAQETGIQKTLSQEMGQKKVAAPGASPLPQVQKTVMPVWNQNKTSAVQPVARVAPKSDAEPAAQAAAAVPRITPAPVTPVAIATRAAELPDVTPRTTKAAPVPASAIAAVPQGFKAKPAMMPIAVVRGAQDPQDAVAASGTGVPDQDDVSALMRTAPKGKIIEIPSARRDRSAAGAGAGQDLPPLPKDPAQVDWAAWDAELEASVGGESADPALNMESAASPAAVAPPPGARIVQKSSGVHVFRGAPGVKISPEAMKRLMELDARQAQAAEKKPEDTTLLGQLRDKAHLQGVMMVYDKDKAQEPK